MAVELHSKTIAKLIQKSGRSFTSLFGAQSAIQVLVAAMGGDARVPFVYSATKNVSVSGGLVQTVDDMRGSSGFGPQLVGNGATKPAFNSGPKTISTSGSNWLQTAKSAKMDLSTNGTLIVIAATPNPAYYAITVADDPYTNPVGYYPAVGGDGTGFQTGTATNPRVAPDGATMRLVINSRAAVVASGGAGATYRYLDVWGRVRQIVDGQEPGATAGNRALCIGGLPNSGALALGAAVTWQFAMYVDHQIGSAERDALAAFIAAEGLAPVAATRAKTILCDGNSLTYGTNSTNPGGSTAWPAVMKSANAALSAYDVMNLGFPGKAGVTMLGHLDGRILSDYDSGRAKQFYVYWEGINNMGQWVTRGDAGLLADIRDACLAARNRGYKVVVCTVLPWASDGLCGGFNTQRLTLNTSIRTAVANGWADAVADLASNPNLSTTTNGTYFSQVDFTHLTDAGYADVANNATYGIYPRLNALGL